MGGAFLKITEKKEKKDHSGCKVENSLQGQRTIAGEGQRAGPMRLAWTIAIVPKIRLENSCKEKSVDNYKQEIKRIFLQCSLGKETTEVESISTETWSIPGLLVRKLRDTHALKRAGKIFRLRPDTCPLSGPCMGFRGVRHVLEKLRRAPGGVSRFLSVLYQAEKANYSQRYVHLKHLFAILPQIIGAEHLLQGQVHLWP